MVDYVPVDPGFEARVRSSFGRQGIMAHLGAEMTACGPGRCEIRVPYGDHLSQQHGFFHGGVVATIADSAGGYAAFSLMPEGSGVLTIEFKINLTAPADGEMLIARGEVMRAGRTITVSRAEVSVIKQGREQVCAILQQTLMTITGRPEVVG